MMTNLDKAGLATAVLISILTIIGLIPADHNKYVFLFENNPQLVREFGEIDPNGDTTTLSSWLYEICLLDSHCGEK